MVVFNITCWPNVKGACFFGNPVEINRDDRCAFVLAPKSRAKGFKPIQTQGLLDIAVVWEFLFRSSVTSRIQVGSLDQI